jgi:hypothetical protein
MRAMTPRTSEILVPDVCEHASQISEKDQSPIGLFPAAASALCSLSVDTLLPARTVAAHGMTGQEIERLTGAMQFMKQRCSLWWLTTDRGTARSIIADIGKRITRLQAEYDLPRYHVTVFEARGGLHAHIAFVGNRQIVDRLKGSATFGEIIEADKVTDPDKLARKYLAKERTPQAGYGRNHILGGRLRGSHRLAGGGDRVRLSRELERDAIDAGYVEVWQHTNARRSAERKAYRLRRLYPRKAPRVAGQLPLLPELQRPVSRLHEFGAGFIPPAVALELEFRRRQFGLSQTQFAAQLGVSQGQYANALRGHDPISAFAVNRAREALFGGTT